MNVRIRRYAEATNYAKVLTGVYNGIPKGENGMIIKYQEPAQPIKYMGGYDKRGNIVLPVNNENGMNNVTLPEVTVSPRNINLAGAVDRGRREAAPYVSTLLTGAIFGPLSVAGGYAGNEAVNKITNVASNDKYKDWADMLSKTTGMNPVVADFFNIGNLAGGFGMRNFGPKLKPVKDMAVGGNKWARARVISKTINKGTPSVEPLPNNVGWGPRQSIHVVHDKNSARFPKLYFPERWDAIHEGAPEVGIWYQGKFGNPRTAANHSIPGKAEKAAKARERFAKRPYRVEGDLELERPIVTVGDVPNRAALERAADKMSADGVIFNNVYDNGYSNNQVIFSLRDDLKNGRLYNKSKELPPILSNSKSGVASPRTSLAFYIRPSKLTKAEKVGIPKGERLEVLPYYSAMSKAQYELFKNLPNNGYNRMVWGYLNRNHAIRHSRKYGPNAVVVKFTHAKDAKMAPEIDANGNIWFGIPNKDNKAKLTDHVVLDNINSGYDVTTINNVNEVGVPSDIIAVHPYVPVKGERIKFKRK